LVLLKQRFLKQPQYYSNMQHLVHIELYEDGIIQRRVRADKDNSI